MDTSEEGVRSKRPGLVVGSRMRPWRGRVVRWILTVIALLVVTSCVTQTPRGKEDLLTFLHSGRTTREEVILQLGQPSASFEQERILTYRVGQQGEQRYYIVTPRELTPWQSVRYSLVLIFDAQGVLQKHKLVEVQ